MQLRCSSGISLCFVTHDVDLLPSLATIDYQIGCESPVQLCSELSCYDDELPYSEYADGVVSAQRSDWIQVNGYTDSPYDWAGAGDGLN